MMSLSIRLRFVGWLQRILDHLPEKLVEILRQAKVHSKPTGNLGDLIRARVPNDVAESQVDNVHVVPSFHQEVCELNRRSIVSDFQPFVPKGHSLTAPNYDLINHQSLPAGKNYAASLNAKAAGV